MGKYILLCFLSILPWMSFARRNPMENPGMYDGDMLGVDLTEDRNAVPTDNQVWPNGVVPYIVDQSLVPYLKLLREGMNYIEQRTCVRFVPRSNEQNYIKMIFGNGCYAHWGRIGGEQSLSLGEGCHYIGTVIHELMHAIGFEHEHNRSDRDDHLNIKWDNIPENWYYAFKKLQPHENRLLTSFDYDSIMLYGGKSFAKDYNHPSMVAKNGKFLEEVYNKKDMTNSDVLRVKMLYKCK